MMNYKKFVEKLEQCDHSTDEKCIVQRFIRDIRGACAENERSDFHQSSSWTRLEAQMEVSAPRKSLSGLLAPALLPAVAGVVLAIWLIPLSADEIGMTDAPNISISESKNHIYVTPFHSKGVDADVIWAEGYQYIPAHYSASK
ncbi:MAG: hypothetical protein AAFY98_04790 [Verrucomicrobiota bacterium]